MATCASTAVTAWVLISPFNKFLTLHFLKPYSDKLTGKVYYIIAIRK